MSSSESPTAAEEPLEQLAGAPGERDAVAILVEARRLADEHEVGVGVPLAEHDVRAPLRERAPHALRRLGGDGVEARSALRRVHPEHFTAAIGDPALDVRRARPVWIGRTSSPGGLR